MAQKSFIISTLFILLISTPIFAQAPDTVWVDDDYNATTAGWGTTHFAVIQEGVDAVAKAGTVNVAAGTWNENIEISGGKSLIGAGIGQSFINGDGTTYTISVTEQEVIETESFIQNFTLNNPSENWGDFEINMDHTYNVTVQNNHLLNNGIMLAVSQNCIISNNLIEGIGNLTLSQTWNSRIENNVLTNGVLFVLDGSSNNTISNNTILDGGCNCIRVGRSSNNLFKNNTVHGARQNFLFTASNDNIIVGNNISGHWDNPAPISAGIVVFRGNNNTIINNIIDDVLDGGITLFGASSNNVIQSNSITNSTRGIDIYYASNNNRIINNTVENNSAGIILDNTSGNVVYDNNLVNNQMNGYDDGTNVWDSGARGNYWSDYEGEDQNGDGVGDTPKLILTAGNDHFPATQIIPVTLATEPSLQLATYKLMDESYVYITDEQTISNEHGELSETFIVQNGGTLILDNVDWEVPYDFLGELIIVESGGTLRITNSKIVTQGGNIKAQEGAALHIENSEFVGLGMTDGEGSLYITCDSAVIKDNVIKNAFSGIGLDAGSGHQIINNRISETFVGININDIITDTRFEGNTIYNSIRSAIMGYLNNSTIINNTFRDIWKETLFIIATQPGQNLIYKNNFFNCSFSRTGWMDSWYLNNQGNYYSDYLDKFPNAQEHASFSGIWDNPYIHYPCSYIDERYLDNYPLMYPVYLDTVVAPPEPPVLLSPPPNAVNIPTETEFGWNPSVAATSYRLQISDDANFETPIFNQGSITEPVKNVNILNDTTLYYWRVLAENLGVISDWSDVRQFTTGEITDIEEVIDNDFPKSFALYQNYPNPFNPTTTIRFDLPKACTVKITIYNMLGKTVGNLISKKYSAGSHTLEWNAQEFSSGFYFYQLEADSYLNVRKLVLLKK